ncbi:acyl-CoA dehydrogenase family protein [Bradyrhizobium sp. 14AA]
MAIPSVDFDLGEDIAMLRDSVRAFFEAEITPPAADIEKANLLPADLWKRLGAFDLLGLTEPEESGGCNIGYLAHIVAMEEISRGSAAVGLSAKATTSRASYLPKLISGEYLGALALSEPTHSCWSSAFRQLATRRSSGPTSAYSGCDR